MFNKHDVDGSGEIDVEEFRGLATDLGTVPELTDEEVAEAVSQIDKSNDAWKTMCDMVYDRLGIKIIDKHDLLWLNNRPLH